MIDSFFVARLSGLPADAVQHLLDPELLDLLREMHTSDRDRRHFRLEASEALYNTIGRVADPKLRHELIAYRRSIFSGNQTSSEIPAEIVTSLSATEHNAVEAQLEADRNNRQIELCLGNAYANAMKRARETLRLRLGHEAFRRGLALSSHTLFPNLARYQVTSIGSKSRAQQVERGLLRYYTRAAMKATPFASFCAIVPGRIQLSEGECEEAAALTIRGSPGAHRAARRLNKLLYGVLWPHLRDRPAVRDCLQVGLNPTLEVDREQCRFLASIGDREVIQRIRGTEPVQLVCELLQTEGSTFAELVDALEGHQRVEASRREVRRFLDELVSAGFLLLKGVVEDQNFSWVRPLTDFLTPIEDPSAQAVKRLLATLDVLTARCEGDATAVAESVQAMREAIDTTLESLGIPKPTGLTSPLYEDVTALANVELRIGRSLRSALGRLEELLSLTDSLGYPRALQRTMCHFFETRFPGEKPVPLVEFFERFYREHFKAHRGLEAKWYQNPFSVAGHDLLNPFKLESVSTIQHNQRTLTELFRKAWQENPGAEEVTVCREDLVRLLQPLQRRGDSPRSNSVFCQIVAKGTRVLVPQADYRVGYGKFFSRFLHLLPSEFLDSVRHQNTTLGDGVAEIQSDSHFNGNLHPSLLAAQIEYPSSYVQHNVATIRITELYVTRSSVERGELRLITADGRIVHPVDLGFLNPRRRPPLFHLLSGFAPSSSYLLALPERPTVQVLQGGNSEIVYRPRFVYADAVVVSRRRWSVPNGLFPVQNKNEADECYFMRVHRWREENGIPMRFFARITVLTGGLEERRDDNDQAGDEGELFEAEVRGEAKHSAKASVDFGRSRDWRKPQYIDLGNPLLVRLFSRLGIASNRSVIQLEECYPDYDDLPAADGTARYAYELVLQVSSRTHEEVHA